MMDREPNILHLAPDEKFIPFVQKVFETAFPGRNRMRVTVGPAGPRYVALSGTVRPASTRYWFGGALREDLRWADCLVVHFMTPWFARAVLKAPARVAVVWGAWGGDFYPMLPRYADGQYLPETRRIVEALGPLLPPPAGLARRAYHALFHALLPRWERDIVQRIDALSTVLPAEYRMIRAAFPALRATYHPLLYGSVEDTFSAGPDFVSGKDILVGNSADPTNNHADAFRVLKGLDLDGRRVIVPLSYGYPRYADEVCRLGTEAFGNRFVPLRQYLPLDAYNATIAGCSILLMNHIRQQATGNISTSLYKGGKVYLRPESPLFSFYAEIGAKVHAMPEPGEGHPDFFAPPSRGEIDANRAALEARYSFKAAVQAARGLAGVVAARRARAS